MFKILILTDVGNEKVLYNTKIKGDRLKEVCNDGSLGPDLSFYFDTMDTMINISKWQKYVI